jgi:hypothetical protein
MNDSRWPWLILVPSHDEIDELHDLTHGQRDAFMADVNQVSRVVKKLHNAKASILPCLVTLSLSCTVMWWHVMLMIQTGLDQSGGSNRLLRMVEMSLSILWRRFKSHFHKFKLSTANTTSASP